MTRTDEKAPAVARRFVARHRWARLTARKARLAAGLIRGRDVNEAIEQLSFSPKRGAAFLLKVLRSAVANASQDEHVDVNRLFVVEVRADDGPLHQGRLRWRPGPQGRAMPIRRRTSHLLVVLCERPESDAELRKNPRRKPARRKRAPSKEGATQA
jgi:large subunit ribosomal protein L22